MTTLFEDRSSAGRLLAARLQHEALRDPVVVALPRGGVPVAAEVARALKAPLEVLVVRKIGAPWQPELAIGALAEGVGTASPTVLQVLEEDHCQRHGVTRTEALREAQGQHEELQRRVERIRAGRPPLALAGRECVAVDDGIATGLTMQAAVQALRQGGAAGITVAVPVAPRDTVESLRRHGVRVVCLEQPEPFVAVGLHYRHFPQVEDEEVMAVLQRARERSGDY